MSHKSSAKITEKAMPVRTSENDPLRIAELPFGKGLMGLTLCPGKKDKEAMTGPCWRSLEADLQAVKDWGAGIIVTLMEEWELQHLHVVRRGGNRPDFGDVARALGIMWWHLPVKDGYPLESENLPLPLDCWTLPCALLRHFLYNGGRVLIHCRGGLGRTGTLAARLLMEEGLDAEKAIQAVRAVRKGAIETEEQENSLRAFRIKDDILERRKELAGLSKSRVEQLVRLMLEVPWAFRYKKHGISPMVGWRVGWSEAIKACLRQDAEGLCPTRTRGETGGAAPHQEKDAAENSRDAAKTAPELMREILAALYDADGDSLACAREYFGIVPAPEPELPERLKNTKGFVE